MNDDIRGTETHDRMEPEVRRAVVRFRIAAETLAGLEGQRITSPVQFSQLTDAQDTMRESRSTLADAGMLHLVEARRTGPEGGAA